jgi:hypothetical protein
VTTDSDLRHFDKLIESLVVSGNSVLDGGFVPTQGGWECHFAGPLDRFVVQHFVDGDPHDVSFDSSTDTVHCRHCWGAVVGGSP